MSLVTNCATVGSFLAAGCMGSFEVRVGRVVGLIGPTPIVEYIPWRVNPIPPMLRGMKRTLLAIQRDLATNLREARANAGLSQEALALAAEVDRTYVSQIERGVGNPSIAVLAKLASKLSVDLVDMLRPR